VDLDVIEMTVANPDSEEVTYDYLQDCRKKLMLKVNAYRSELESLIKLKWLLNIAPRLIVSGPFIKLLHL